MVFNYQVSKYTDMTRQSTMKKIQGDESLGRAWGRCHTKYYDYMKISFGVKTNFYMNILQTYYEQIEKFL